MLTLTVLSDESIAGLFEDSRKERCHTVIEGALESPPRGWWRNCRAATVGHGDVDFEIARQCLRMWRHFPANWAEPISDGPTTVGQQVAIVARCLGFCVTNVCRVIDVSEHHSDGWATFAVVYSTCSGHDMDGAERFRLTWDKTSDVVTYEVSSYSRPRSLLARTTLPYVRSLQTRFGRESCDRVASYVASFRSQLRPDTAIPTTQT